MGGSGLNATSDHDCDCFATLGFCKDGEKPVYTPGQKCPSCWPKENKACYCFASIGFCEPPPHLLPVLEALPWLRHCAVQVRCLLAWPRPQLHQRPHLRLLRPDRLLQGRREAHLHCRCQVPELLAQGEQGLRLLRFHWLLRELIATAQAQLSASTLEGSPMAIN